MDAMCRNRLAGLPIRGDGLNCPARALWTNCGVLPAGFDFGRQPIDVYEVERA
jgi:hypothetical protein